MSNSVSGESTPSKPCAMCGRTYGVAIADRPDRCGVCITGLSLDGRPIYPTADELSPITGGKLIHLPGDIWTYDMTTTASILGLDASPEAEYAASIRSMLGNWPGYRQLLIDEGIAPEPYERKAAA